MGSVLRETRERSGMTLDFAARELRISPGYLHQIEKGVRGVDSQRARQIADLYKRGSDELFIPVRFSARCCGEGGEA